MLIFRAKVVRGSIENAMPGQTRNLITLSKVCDPSSTCGCTLNLFIVYQYRVYGICIYITS